MTTHNTLMRTMKPELYIKQSASIDELRMLGARAVTAQLAKNTPSRKVQELACNIYRYFHLQMYGTIHCYIRKDKGSEEFFKLNVFRHTRADRDSDDEPAALTLRRQKDKN